MEKPETGETQTPRKVIIVKIGLEGKTKHRKGGNSHQSLVAPGERAELGKTYFNNQKKAEGGAGKVVTT
jgi:hypothetical protein